MGKNFFISYTATDRAWAEWVAWQLEAAGYSTRIQAWDFRPGFNFVGAMQEAAREDERTIAILSPDYMRSLYTLAEWSAALHHYVHYSILERIIIFQRFSGLINRAPTPSGVGRGMDALVAMVYGNDPDGAKQ